MMYEHAASAPLNEDWRTLVLPQLGTRAQYPYRIFSLPEGKPEKGVGERLSTDDGRATLAVYSRANGSSDTPASYLTHYLRTPRAQLDYQRVAPSFFAISAVKDDTIYYSRCNFSLSAFIVSISSIPRARSVPGMLSSPASACLCGRCKDKAINDSGV
jgi:hypothetical protein